MAHQTKVVNLLASATRTATATGTGQSTVTTQKPLVPGGVAEGLTRHMHVFQTIGTVSGTSPTLDLTVEGSVDGGTTWFTLTASSAWTQVTASTSKQVRRYEGPIPPHVRAVATIGGTSPSFGTHKVDALLGG